MERSRLARMALAALLPCVASALRVEVPPQPVSPYADTEASTNIAINRARSDVRELKMLFSFEGVASNCIQVAFGRDADGDGILSFGETDAVYGWRNGRHFAEDARNHERIEAPDATSARTLSVSMRLARDLSIDRLSATDDSGAAVLTNLSASMTWLYRPEWNLMRVTRRGPGIPAEWFVGEIRYNHLVMTVR